MATAAALLATAIVFRLLSMPDTRAPGRSMPAHRQLAVSRKLQVRRYCPSYSIVLGGSSALSIWMARCCVGKQELSITRAALLAVCSLPGGILRAVGGSLSGRFVAHGVTSWILWAAWISLVLLS